MRSYLEQQFRALKRSKRTGLRQCVGVALVIGGVLGFLPVLGYWMFPLGLALLSVDSPRCRRLYRRMRSWWGRQGQRLRPRPTVRTALPAAVPIPEAADSPGTHSGP